MSSYLASGKSAFLHDGYIAAIENCCAPTAVMHTLFPKRVEALLLGASYNTIFAALNVIVIRCLIQHKVVATEFYT